MPKKIKRIPKHQKIWKKIRKPAPKVPDITCPIIDDVLNRLEKLSNTTQKLSVSQYKTLSTRLEKLRTMNEQLRESGQYWHNACEKLVDDVFKYKKYKI